LNEEHPNEPDRLTGTAIFSGLAIKLGYKLAFSIFNTITGRQLRFILRSIGICEKRCETSCPIWDIEKTLLTPLRNIQEILESYEIPRESPQLILANTSKEETNK